MNLSSTAFSDGEAIPSPFTCTGRDIAPPLSTSDVPGQAKSLSLIMDDPDAPVGTFVHWVVWNIPPDAKELGHGINKGVQGMTDFGRIGYGGPCPPSGKHRYYFKLYALDCMLQLSEHAGKRELEQAMKGHILAQAQLMGTYTR